MAGETLVTVIGNLTADPELRATAQGPQVCGFTIASTTRTWDRQTGRYEDGDTLFMRCSAWRDLAEHCASTLAKGIASSRADACANAPGRRRTARAAP